MGADFYNTWCFYLAREIYAICKKKSVNPPLWLNDIIIYPNEFTNICNDKNG